MQDGAEHKRRQKDAINGPILHNQATMLIMDNEMLGQRHKTFSVSPVLI